MSYFDGWNWLEKKLEADGKEYRQACVCKYCKTKRPLARNTQYNKKHKYNCHGCGAEYATVPDNFFWVYSYGYLYDLRN